MLIALYGFGLRCDEVGLCDLDEGFRFVVEEDFFGRDECDGLRVRQEMSCEAAEAFLSSILMSNFAHKFS